MNDELVDTYDELGNPLGAKPCRFVHDTGLWHRTFHLWITDIDSAGNFPRVVCQRRGLIKHDYPNLVDVGVSGHYQAGEGLEGGLREAREELGLNLTSDQFVRLGMRSVDERLDSGAINRERQDVFWLEVPRLDLATLRIGFPEVQGVIRCGLDTLRRLCAGKVDHIEVESRSADPSDVIDTAQLVRSDFVPEIVPYMGFVLRRIRALRAGGGLDHPDIGDIGDGSTWLSADHRS